MMPCQAQNETARRVDALLEPPCQPVDPTFESLVGLCGDVYASCEYTSSGLATKTTSRKRASGMDKTVRKLPILHTTLAAPNQDFTQKMDNTSADVADGQTRKRSRKSNRKRQNPTEDDHWYKYAQKRVNDEESRKGAILKTSYKCSMPGCTAIKTRQRNTVSNGIEMLIFHGFHNHPISSVLQEQMTAQGNKFNTEHTPGKRLQRVYSGKNSNKKTPRSAQHQSLAMSAWGPTQAAPASSIENASFTTVSMEQASPDSVTDSKLTEVSSLPQETCLTALMEVAPLPQESCLDMFIVDTTLDVFIDVTLNVVHETVVADMDSTQVVVGSKLLEEDVYEMLLWDDLPRNNLGLA